jgi:hypothetical protein
MVWRREFYPWRHFHFLRDRHFCMLDKGWAWVILIATLPGKRKAWGWPRNAGKIAKQENRTERIWG